MEHLQSCADVFERALSFLSGPDLVAASAVNRTWHAAAHSEHLWLQLCRSDWGIEDSVSPPSFRLLSEPRTDPTHTWNAGTALPTFKVAWRAWFTKYRMYISAFEASKAIRLDDHSLVPRMANCWLAVHQFAAANNVDFFLRPGLTRDALRANQDPMCSRLLRAFHDGQTRDENAIALFGGYSYYHQHSIRWFLPHQPGAFPGLNILPVTVPPYVCVTRDMEKILARMRHGETRQATPDMPYSLLAWFVPLLLA